MPATWAVQLNPPGSGTPGDTAANHAGSLSLNPDLPTTPGGYAYVEANSAVDAVALAIVGTIHVQAGSFVADYVFGPSTLGGSAADHKAFLFANGNTIQFEDMALFAGGSDWDYNDRTWYVGVMLVPGGEGGSGGGGGGTNPPPVPPPPTSPPPPPATPSISISPFFHPTEGGIGQFNITRSTGAGELTVSYSTPTGTALEGLDYVGLDSNNRTVTLLDGQTVVPVYFQAIDDPLVELPETVIAELNPVAGYTVVGGPATVTITDNDGEAPPAPPAPAPAPTLYAVELITDGVGGGGDANSAATFYGQLMLNQSYASLPRPGADQRILVSAANALEAARLALTGTIYATFVPNGRAQEHIYSLRVQE